jgi:hypothetical protein
VRTVEPYRMVIWGRRWYLVAWDVERGDWRTFRVDFVVTDPPELVAHLRELAARYARSVNG